VAKKEISAYTGTGAAAAPFGPAAHTMEHRGRGSCYEWEEQGPGRGARAAHFTVGPGAGGPAGGLRPGGRRRGKRRCGGERGHGGERRRACRRAKPPDGGAGRLRRL